MILFVATTNRDKLREIRALLADAPVTLASLADVPAIVEPDETGTTFEANAIIKAVYYDQVARSMPLAANRACARRVSFGPMPPTRNGSRKSSAGCGR